MTTFNWSIDFMETKPVGDLQDVVVTAGWRCTGEKDGESLSTYTTAYFGEPSEDFIAYENLTEAEVLEWVWQKVDKAETEAKVEAMFAKVTPEVKPLPWAA